MILRACWAVLYCITLVSSYDGLRKSTGCTAESLPWSVAFKVLLLQAAMHRWVFLAQQAVLQSVFEATISSTYVYSYAATPKKPASTRIAPTIMRAAAAALCNQAGCVYMRSRNTASGTCAERPTVATVGPANSSQVSCEQDAVCH